MKQSEISFYVDTLIVEAVLCADGVPEDGFYKKASIMGDLLSKVKGYVDSKIDPNNKVGSVVNMLAPAVISTALGAMGFGWWRILLGLAMSVFHIDVWGAFQRVWEWIKEAISGGKQVRGEDVEQQVHSAIQANTKQVSDESEAQEAMQQAQSMKALTAHSSFTTKMRQARMLKLAMMEYERNSFALTKEGFSLNPLQWFSKGQSTTSSLLSTILSWIFKVVLASAGFLVAGDVINKFLGRPNSLDGTYQAGSKELGGQAVPSAPAVSQTKFPANPSYQEPPHPSPWIEAISNDPSSIGNMLVGWSKAIYSGLDGKDSLISSSPAFQAVRDQIAWYNHSHAGDNYVFIPKIYSSRKAAVDYFIDDVAKMAK